MTRKLTATESNTAIVTYLCIFYVLVTGLALPFVWIPPDLINLGIMICMGLLGVAAQFAITHAYRCAAPPVIAPFDYTMMLWGVLLGFFIWGDLPTLPVYIGASVLISSGLYLVYREARSG